MGPGLRRDDERGSSRDDPDACRVIPARHFPLRGNAGRMARGTAGGCLGSVGMDVREAEIRIDTSRGGYLDRALELRPMLAAAGDEIQRGREVTPANRRAMTER